VKEDKRIEKRSRILDAAGELFMNQGVENTKIIDIAKASGVAKGTVYEYFDSKEAIAIEWVRAMFEDFRKRLTSIRESQISFKEKLCQYYDCCFEQLSQVMLKSKMMIREGAAEGVRPPHPDPDELKKCIEKGSLFSVLMENAGFEVQVLKDMLTQAIEKGEVRNNIDVTFVTAFILSNIPFMGFLLDKSESNEMVMKYIGMTDLSFNSRDICNLVADGIGV